MNLSAAPATLLRLLCGFCLWLILAQAQAAEGSGNDSAEDPDDSHQILVMLRAPPPHYRPDAQYADSYRAAPGREARRRIARALASEHGLSVRTDWPMPALGLDCFVLDAADAAAVQRALRALPSDPRVESAQPVQRFQVLAQANAPAQTDADPLYPVQPAKADWRLDELHKVATGKGVTVAVIDSGVATEHPDLRGQVALARNFVDGRAMPGEAHGTEVAGLIAAREGNGVGIVGIAPQARLLALRACWQEGEATAACNSFTLAKALQFAIDQRAQVLNLSLSGPRDPLLGRLLDVAVQRGAAVVGAVDARAGDGGFPASHAGVLAVVESGRARTPVAAFAAPGRGVPTTRADGGWGLVDGSSFAAAQVSGLVALLRQRAPRFPYEQLRTVLSPSPGVGLAEERPQPIDACTAMRRVGGQCVCDCSTSSSGIMAMPRQ